MLRRKQHVDGNRAGFVGRGHGLDLPLGGNAAVEIRLAEDLVGLHVADGKGQLVREFQFGLLQLGPFLGQLQLGIAHAGHLAAETDGHGELEAQLPFLDIGRRSAIDRRSSSGRC